MESFLDGVLADYVFTTLMKSNIFLVSLLNNIVGKNNGSGMAIMFLCTSIIRSLWCVSSYLLSKYIQTDKSKSK